MFLRIKSPQVQVFGQHSVQPAIKRFLSQIPPTNVANKTHFVFKNKFTFSSSIF